MGDKPKIEYTAPFIWDHTDKAFDEVVRLNSSGDPENTETTQPNSTWYADPLMIERMKKKETYQQLAENYETKKDLFSHSSICEYGVIQSPCKITNIGTIYHMNSLTYYTNGGCRCRDIKHEEISLNDHMYQTINHPVISVTELWGHGIWHFPYEVFVALCSMPKHLLHSSIIHVNDKTPYIMWWISQLDIKPSLVISGHIYSKKQTIIPRLGKCGNPYVNQIHNIQQTIYKHIPPKLPDKYVTIVKRTKSRKTKNFNELFTLIKQFAQSIGLEVYVHDDSALPDLFTQQRAFHQSKYVFSPHGAAGIHIPAMKRNSNYIELMNDGRFFNMCYGRIAYWTNVNYYVLPMNDSIVSLDDVIELIQLFI